MGSRSKKPSCQKAFRDKDIQVLSKIATGAPGNLWRQPMIEAMKRAGASVVTDDKRRLLVVFGEYVVHPSRLDLGKAEDFNYATPLGQQLQVLARELLAHKGYSHT